VVAPDAATADAGAAGADCPFLQCAQCAQLLQHLGVQSSESEISGGGGLLFALSAVSPTAPEEAAGRLLH